MEKKIKVRPVRFVPFDLGGKLTDSTIFAIKEYLEKNFHLYSNTKRHQVLFSKQPVISCINLDKEHDSKLELYIFTTGIGVFVIHDLQESFNNDALIFVPEYLLNRKKAHADILRWEHKFSSLINLVLNNLWKISNKKFKTVRPSAHKTWENNGISYVMTIAYIKPFENIETYSSWSDLPQELIKSIPILLNPSSLYMEDSLSLSQNHTFSIEQLKLLVSKMQSPPRDYEMRNYFSTYMSWAAVLIVGNSNDIDQEDYVLLEVELQHYWYYLYCLENCLPPNEELLGRSRNKKISIEQVVAMKFECELIEENIKYVGDSSTPERYELIIDGLMKTSGITELLHRYRKKLDFYKELLSVKQQTRQKILNQSSEIFLAAIAYLQIAPNLFDFIGVKWGINNVDRYLLLTATFIVISLVLVMKNRH